MHRNEPSILDSSALADLLIRTFFQLSVAGSGLGGVVHARQPLAQYRLGSETGWEVMAQYGKGCALSQQALAPIGKDGAGNRKLIIRVSRNVCCSEAGVQHARCPSEATRASHGPDEIDKYAFVV